MKENNRLLIISLFLITNAIFLITLAASRVMPEINTPIFTIFKVIFTVLALFMSGFVIGYILESAKKNRNNDKNEKK